MCEVVVCDTSVELKFGDITGEKTDVIVNPTNATLDQSKGTMQMKARYTCFL